MRNDGREQGDEGAGAKAVEGGDEEEEGWRGLAGLEGRGDGEPDDEDDEEGEGGHDEHDVEFANVVGEEGWKDTSDDANKS